MANKWVEHIRAFAKKHNLSYGCALSDPKCKETYKSGKEAPPLETPMRTSRIIKPTPPKGEPPKPKPSPKNAFNTSRFWKKTTGDVPPLETPFRTSRIIKATPPTSEPPATKSKKPKAKLTKENVLEIRRLYIEGNMTQQQLADMFGVNRVQITHIVNQNRWKNI